MLSTAGRSARSFAASALVAGGARQDGCASFVLEGRRLQSQSKRVVGWTQLGFNTERNATGSAGPGYSPRPMPEFNQPSPAGSEAGADADRAAQSRKSYTRSTLYFKDKTVKLQQSYAGHEDNRKIHWYERLHYDWFRYFFTGERIVGKDRQGNLFCVKWFFYRHRNEIRKCYRLDHDKRHQPYGAFPNDHKLWVAWMKGWRHDPPTPEEEEIHREDIRTFMGPHVVGEEEYEDAVVRSLAHTPNASSVLNEMDSDETFNKFLNHYNKRDRDKDPHKENATWTVGLCRGDLFYNEEETEMMRTSLGHIFRDREWQALEMKRQTRTRKQPYTVRMPEDPTDPNSHQGEPPHHYYERTDQGVPFDTGVEQLTTPALEKVKAECDALEDERVRLRKELGLTDLGDFREGRAPVEKGYAPFQPHPTSKRWKPKCWNESWGTGGGGVWQN